MKIEWYENVKQFTDLCVTSDIIINNSGSKDFGEYSKNI